MKKSKSISLKAAVQAKKAVRSSVSEEDDRDDVSVTSSVMSAREKRFSNIPVSPNACLFNFKSKGKTGTTRIEVSSDEGGRRTRRSVERASSVVSLNKVEVAKDNPTSKIPVIRKVDKASKPRRVGRPKKSDSFLHTTTSSGEDDYIPVSKTSKFDRGVDREAPQRNKPKDESMVPRPNEPKKSKENEAQSDTFTKEVHGKGNANSDQQRSKRRTTYTASQQMEGSSNSTELGNATSKPKTPAAPHISPHNTEPAGKQPSLKSSAEQKSENKKNSSKVIGPIYNRPGPASRTIKASVRASYEPDSICVNLNWSDDDTSDTQSILPRVAVTRQSVATLDEVVEQSRKTTLKTVPSQCDMTGDIPVDLNIGQSNMPTAVDSSSYGSVTLACLVDSDLEEYRLLRNSIPEGFVGVPLNSTSVRYAFPQNLTWDELCPGVFLSLWYDDRKIRVGYVRIESRTVKRMERSGTHNMTFSVIDGTVVVKSANFDFNESGQPYLKSVELFSGCSFIIPPNTMYSLENWSSDEASLLYTVSKED